MYKKILLFFALLGAFTILIFLGNVDLEINNLFLKTIIGNKIWQFIILGIGFFIYGKKIIDSFYTENKDI